MYVLGTAYFVTPLLGVGVHAGIEVCVVEDDGVCIKHSPNCRAAAVGQDAAEHLPVPVELLHILLQGHNTKHIDHTGTKAKKCISCLFFAQICWVFFTPPSIISQYIIVILIHI